MEYTFVKCLHGMDCSPRIPCHLQTRISPVCRYLAVLLICSRLLTENDMRYDLDLSPGDNVCFRLRAYLRA
jgi:hypothetical protein